MMNGKVSKQTGTTKPSRGQKSSMMKAKPGSMGKAGGKAVGKKKMFSKKSSY